MIECLKIENFVIDQMFRPYIPSICPSDYEKEVERKLRKNPEYIIELLENDLGTKGRIFDRISRCGGVKFYRYLDMDNPVIRYVKNSLSEVGQ